MGCAAAYYLSSSASVAVIERGQINQGASGQNAGSLHFQIEHRLLQNNKELTKELEHYVALTQLAIAYWQGMEQELDCDVELVMDGGLMVAETDAEIDLLQRKSDLEKSQGLRVELLDKDETLKLAPCLSERVKAALFCPCEGHCNPRLLTPVYAGKATDRGADIFTNSRVTAVHRDEGKWRIDLLNSEGSQQRETLVADVVLNAAGAWAGEVATMSHLRLPLFPVGLIMNVTEKRSPLIHHLIQHAGRKLSIKQVHDGNILIGGGWSAPLAKKQGLWLSNSSPLVNIDTVIDNLRTAVDIVPQVKDLHLLRTWTGTTALAPDPFPVLGRAGQTADYYVAAGGSGFTYGPVYARLMSELILTGSSSFPLEAYSPNRFGPGV